MLPNDIASLIAFKKLDSLTQAETLRLETWRNASVLNEEAFQCALENPNWHQDLAQIDAIDVPLAFHKVTARIQQSRAKTRLRFTYFAAAASVLLVCCFALLFYQFSKSDPIIQPGGNKAVLTLAGGATVELSEGQKEIVISDSLIYGDGSGIAGLDSKSVNSAMMEISTPKGGEYTIVLSDQTKIKLNASSSIRFPRLFRDKPRVIELHGEAYFEVSPRKLANQKPQAFIVKTPMQTVEVLGTHFNVSAYAEQKETQTTLLEGLVSVSSALHANRTVMLKPGQQAVNTSDEAIKVRSVDVYNYVAWTKNQFIFNAEPLSAVMQKISRWYDLDYEFRQDRHKLETVEGILPRYASVGELLQLLQESKNIRFKLEGRKVIIY